MISNGLLGTHISVSQSIPSKSIDVAVVPGRCTKYIQALDVSWNKQFKTPCTDKFHEWVVSCGMNRVMDYGNLKPPL